MINRKTKRTANIAFFSVVHGVYFEQFEGLEESLIRYHRETVALVEEKDVCVFDYGMVDSNTKAYEVAERIR